MLPKMCVCGGVRGGKRVPRNLFLCAVDSRKEIFWGENVGGGVKHPPFDATCTPKSRID